MQQHEPDDQRDQPQVETFNERKDPVLHRRRTMNIPSGQLLTGAGMAASAGVRDIRGLMDDRGSEEGSTSWKP